MRFRARFGAYEWILLLNAGVCTLDLSLRRRSTFDVITDIFVILVGFAIVYDYLFDYWELDSAGLRRRHFWRKQEVAWDEVRKVGRYTLWGLPSGHLEVDYARPTAKSGRGRILANPADRTGFIAAMRRFAPPGTFDM